MKRYLKILLLVVISIFLVDVYAVEYNPYDSIPITSSNATIKTNHFTYNGVNYNKNLDETNSTYFSFAGIVNSTNKKVPVTVAIGLFDKDGRNIGTIFYCTKRDYDSKYSGLEIKSNKSTPFKISAKKKYFVENRSATEIVSYSILSDNIDCESAGFTKYKGLTLAEIQDGVKPQKEEVEDQKIDFNFNFLKTISGNLALGLLIISIIVAIIAYIFYCYVLNALYKKMYNTASSLVFVPIVNTFICVKMAFGPLIALIWAVLYGISILIAIFGISIISSIVSIFSLLAFIVCIIKLITKNYALLYFDPNVKKEIKKAKDINKKEGNKFVTNADAVRQGLLHGNEESLIEETSAEPVKIDLNYSEADVEKVSNDYFDISAGFNNSSINSTDTGATSVDTSNGFSNNNLVDFMGSQNNVSEKESGADKTTNFSSILDLNDEEEEKDDLFDDDFPNDN